MKKEMFIKWKEYGILVMKNTIIKMLEKGKDGKKRK
jgi:hypothetical protein